ncbi:hypothetical protein MKX08_004808 [Trichoderma sp. CBMAI-0020]|nr:hypothetical protein MKX08_004808 [Trichoderma sp. CBMAI-0020]
MSQSLANWYGEELVHLLITVLSSHGSGESDDDWSQSWSTRAETVPTPVSNAPGWVVRAGLDHLQYTQMSRSGIARVDDVKDLRPGLCAAQTMAPLCLPQGLVRSLVSAPAGKGETSSRVRLSSFDAN